MLLWILLAIAALLFLLFITPLRIHILYERKKENDQANIEVTCWFRLIRLRYELPMVKLKAENGSPEVEAKLEQSNPVASDQKKHSVDAPQAKRWHRRYQELLANVHDFQDILKRMLKHVRCEKLEWETRLGLGEAMGTGAITGIAWGLKNLIVAMIAHYVTMRTTPRVSIQPEWNNQLLHTHFRCILRFMVGHAMIAAVRIFVKYLKGREQKWQTTPSEV
ncbi:DUF2953 domain-containing protein [Brevibacillus migulae]|uniref:DUF2953 domain-containing protein n=1 Tax=Brevibacillus migulae TaxID=1644114 RepID=UPI00106E77EA|nr:DUF2953 domain-containing protein [Brevibacillus migulae]